MLNSIHPDCFPIFELTKRERQIAKVANRLPGSHFEDGFAAATELDSLIRSLGRGETTGFGHEVPEDAFVVEDVVALKRRVIEAKASGVSLLTAETLGALGKNKGLQIAALKADTDVDGQVSVLEIMGEEARVEDSWIEVKATTFWLSSDRQRGASKVRRQMMSCEKLAEVLGFSSELPPSRPATHGPAAIFEGPLNRGWS